MTHPKSDFLKYNDTPFMRFILPIIPAGAQLSDESSLTAEHLGKIPGSWSSRQHVWYGFPKWQSYFTNKFDLEKWHAWQDDDKAGTAIAVAARLGPMVALDVDVNDQGRAEYVEMLAHLVLGPPLVIRRREGSARRVLLYPHKPRTMPIEKNRVAWTVEEGGEVNAVEILGLGQQVVIEGPHAKGAMHYWQDGKGLTDLTLDEIKAASCLVIEDIVSFVQKIRSWIDNEGWTIHQSGRSKARERGQLHEISSPTSDLWLKPDELPTLVTAMRAIDLDSPQVDYDRFINLQRALCAATGCDIDFLHNEVWPWVCTQTIARGNGPRTEERGIEWLEDKWRTFHKSEIGADYVYGVAAAEPFNCKEAQDALRGPDATALFGPPTDQSAVDDNPRDSGQSLQLGLSSGLPGGPAGGDGGGGGNGPTPPTDSDIAIRDSFIAQHGQRFRFIPELGREAGWHELSNGLWRPAYAAFASAVSNHCSVIGDWYRANGGRAGAAIDKVLKNGNTHTRIERMLSKSTELVTTLHRFDTTPYLLNTPGCVVDLRTMTGHEHDNDDLFRLCAAVTPDWGLNGPPEKWLGALNRLAKGKEEWLPETLQLIFGYCLTGYTDWQLSLFIPGIKGTGKSLIIKVLLALIGSYAKLKNPEWFVLRRFGDDRFAYDDMAGLRVIFGTETLDNSTWNETRLVQIIDGDQLDVEFKRGAKTSIRSQAKIINAGNHEPRFPAGDRAGGLTRRMLRWYIGKEFVVTEEDTGLLQALIEEEGPQIMTWLIEGAYKALQLGKKGFLELAQPLLDATAVYVDESNPRAQWVEDRRIVEGDQGKDYLLLKDLYHDYLQFRQTAERGYHETLRVFRTGMEEDFGWTWEKVHRGEPDKTKHGYVAVYGRKRAGAPDGVE